LLCYYSSEELGRYGTFASQSIDYYAHLQALERRSSKLGLRRSIVDMARVLWIHAKDVAVAAWAVLKSPWTKGACFLSEASGSLCAADACVVRIDCAFTSPMGITFGYWYVCGGAIWASTNVRMTRNSLFAFHHA
jgi:hypothetical protein